MSAAEIIDLSGEAQSRSPRRKTSTLAEMALDKCEETYWQRDWDKFRYWHAVFVRERSRLGSDRSQ